MKYMSLEIKHMSLDFTSIIASSVLSSIFTEAINSFKKVTKDTSFIDKNVFEYSLNQYAKRVITWSDDMNFKDLGGLNKSITKTYIPLDYYVTPRNVILENDDKTVKLEKILEDTKHSIILGTPGAGKTTAMKCLCRKIFLDENFYPNYKLPLVIKFRDLYYNDFSEVFLYSEILNILGINKEEINSIRKDIEGTKKNKYDECNKGYKILNNEEIKYKLSKLNSCIKKTTNLLLENLNSVLILDGFDEIPSYEYKEVIVKNLNDLFLSLENTKIILTTRTGEFHYSLNNSRQFEVKPLDKKQIQSFVNKWFTNKSMAKDCYAQFENSPYSDTTVRPLTIAHLCAIFEREGKIPNKPKSMYKKIINLLLEEWNLQNSIHKKSKFSNFESDRKFDFLSYLSYELTINRCNTFCREDLKILSDDIFEHFGFKKEDIYDVLNEIESHNGIFVQTGYARYEFSHNSLKEFLAADFLSKLSSLPRTDIILNIPNEMAICTVLSSLPNKYFSEFIINYLDLGVGTINFLSTYIFRLIVEKVDFKRNLLLGIAFSYIYTYCIFENEESLDKKDVIKNENKFREITTLIDIYFGDIIRESIKILKDRYLDKEIKKGNYILFRPLKGGDWKFYDTTDIKGINKLPSHLIIPQKYFPLNNKKQK